MEIARRKLKNLVAVARTESPSVSTPREGTQSPLSAEYQHILAMWQVDLQSRLSSMDLDCKEAHLKERETQKEVDNLEGTRAWLKSKIASLSNSGDDHFMKEALQRDTRDVKSQLQGAIDCLGRVQVQRQRVDGEMDRQKLYRSNLEFMIESIMHRGLQLLMPLPTATSDYFLK